MSNFFKVGKNSAVVGFAFFFILIISLVTAIYAAAEAFSNGHPFLGVIALLTLVIWIGIVVFSYRNFETLKTGFSHEKE